MQKKDTQGGIISTVVNQTNENVHFMPKRLCRPLINTLRHLLEVKEVISERTFLFSFLYFAEYIHY